MWPQTIQRCSRCSEREPGLLGEGQDGRDGREACQVGCQSKTVECSSRAWIRPLTCGVEHVWRGDSVRSLLGPTTHHRLPVPVSGANVCAPPPLQTEAGNFKPLRASGCGVPPLAQTRTLPDTKKPTLRVTGPPGSGPGPQLSVHPVAAKGPTEQGGIQSGGHPTPPQVSRPACPVGRRAAVSPASGSFSFH